MKSYLKMILLITIAVLAPNCSNDSDEVNSSGLPVLTTELPFNITINSAVSGGDISSDGGSAITAKGLVYSTTTDPSLDDSVKTVGSGNGDFQATIDGLLPNQFYYIKSYATNSNGTAYGQEIKISTLIPGAPVVTTVSVESIKNNTALVRGKVMNHGDASVTLKGFVWSTNPNPTILNNKLEIVSDSDIFSGQLPNLNRNTTYHVRAFATNTFGTSYGQEKTFTTLNNYLMFTANQIHGQVFHNPQDKTLNLITYDHDIDGARNFKLIAYNYISKTIIQERLISTFSSSFERNASHSISTYNNQHELYIVSKNAVSILNPTTLQVINTINFPSDYSLKGAKQKNGLIFINYTIDNATGSKIAVYSRNTLDLVSEIPISSSYISLCLYKDLANSNQIKCIVFQNEHSFNIETYDNLGNHLSSGWGTDYEGGNFIETRDDLDFVIKGARGRIFSKDNLSTSPTTLSPSITQPIRNCTISPDGNYIYTIQDDYSYAIVKYNTVDFTMDSFIPINEFMAKNIFMDNNNFLVVDYINGAVQKEVYFTMY